MGRGLRDLVGCALALCAVGLAASASAEDPVINEVLSILKERGIVDEARYGELVSKNEQYQEKHDGLLGRIEFSGDLRARAENFWYEDTALDEGRSNRMRARYRLRIQGKAKVNDNVNAIFRLASGEGEHRSTNRTLGKDNDFGPDSIFIDRAYLELVAPSEWLPEFSSLEIHAGKVKNPFTWKNGKDYLLWDHDINPEGVSLLFSTKPWENGQLFLNTGYYILDENSTATDPHVLGVQGGLIASPSEEIEMGARVSWYSWHSLNPAFFGRSAGVGNIIDGLSDEAPSQTNDGMNTGELAAFVKIKRIENWPILLFGHYAVNFDAESSTLFAAPGDEDTGWGVGVEVGDKKKFVKLGAGYYRAEANFWPSQFSDSDLFDGVSNRKGWTVYGSRQILPNTDLGLTLFIGGPLRESLPGFATSLRNSDRVRLQTDLVVKF